MKAHLFFMAVLMAAPSVSSSWADPQQEAPPLAFEVASVKASDPAAHIGAVEFGPGGKFTATNVPLLVIILRAYDLRDFQLSGGPGWLRDRYVIQAKAPEGHFSEAQVRLMLQNLLAERFQLKLHRETKDMPVYALMVGKNGPKVPKAKDDLNSGPGSIGVGRGSITARGAPFATVAIALSRLLDRPVLDETGLPGNYDFRLHYDPNSAGVPLTGLRERTPAQEAAEPSDAEPSIFAAVQEQLGLKLEAQKRPIEVFVIDSIQRPSPN